MANQWTIEIRRAAGDGVFFLPFVVGAKPGEPLIAEAADTILWSNRTSLDIELKSTNPAGLPLDQRLGPGASSDQLFVFGGGTIQYECTNPQQPHEIRQPPPVNS